MDDALDGLDDGTDGEEVTETAYMEGDDVALQAAREALIPRIRKGDLDAIAEFFELTGGKVKWIRRVDDESG